MFLKGKNFMHLLRRIVLPMVVACAALAPDVAFAKWEIVDRLNLAPFIPNVLDGFMVVARGGYEYFVGNGTGIIYILVWTFLALSIFMYAFKMYFPKRWIEFLGLSGGGEMWDGKIKGFDITENVLKNLMRGVIAATFLLQVRPTFVTEWLVNPFLEFGSIYSGAILDAQNMMEIPEQEISCPPAVMSGDWISERSCNFLIRPVSELSAVNNVVIKHGFEFLTHGLFSLLSPMTQIPQHGHGILDTVTGILLIFSFFGCNMFMALLIIQGIFNFGMALILYPFSVLAWVAKPSDKWFDIWPAFGEIIKALRALVITMIACAFILIINVAVVRALFHFDPLVFNGAIGGNTETINFSGHSMLWLSSIMTFFVMNAIFDLTRKRLEEYAPGQTDLYNQAKSDFNANVNRAKSIFKSAKKIIGLVK